MKSQYLWAILKKDIGSIICLEKTNFFLKQKKYQNYDCTDDKSDIAKRQ